MVAAAIVCSALAYQVETGSTKTVRGSGHVLAEDRAVSDLSGVELATIGRLYVEVGEREALRIEAEDNLLPYIETEVRDGTLTIKPRRGIDLRTTHPVRYYLSVTDLDRIVASSSGNVTVADAQLDRLSVTLSSSGDLEVGDLECDTLTVHLTGSGDATMGRLYATTLIVQASSSGAMAVAGGEVERQEITISGSGDYTALKLKSADAEVTLSSSGNAAIQVYERLRADLTSSGNLGYAGTPTVDVRKSSSGHLVWVGG